ncbi:MAG: NAD(P)-dependent oxidoreductase [Chloroflexi bacterium]|nr:NAD(P)-dependent oxidoreductase [Chloroflexota bacterium]
MTAEQTNGVTRIVVPDDDPPVFTDSAALARLRRLPDVEVISYTERPGNPYELIERISGSHTLIVARTTTRVNNTVLEGAAPGLKHVAIWGTAVDHVALEAARRLDVVVTNTPNAATVAVAEHALALLLSLARKIPQLDMRVRGGEWPGGQLTQLAGRTLGIVGTGAIGVRLARIAEGIGMRILMSSLSEAPASTESSNWTDVSFSELLASSDAISLHARLTPQTRSMFGAAEFARMKPTALFVNTARGQLVNLRDLAEALANETIAGAALDVFHAEPLDRNSPLTRLPNVILTPHIAANTGEALNVSLNMVIDNVIDFLQGRVRHRVS